MSKEKLITDISHPKHIAIIMDGNGRWAKKRMFPRFIGHQKGLKAVRKVVSFCANENVESLTLFAFSTENWKRPKDEVVKLMSIFLRALQKEVRKLNDNNVRLRIIGDRSAFSEEIQLNIIKAENLTKNNNGLNLNIAANYGGRWDIIQATKSWQQANISKDINELTENELEPYLSLAGQQDPDLLIRTGGEKRVSNFLIWQMAYAEYYFTDELWPDVNEKSLQKAINSFSGRERRFGQTSEQINKC